MVILRNSYRYWNFSPNDVLAELEISIWGLKKRPLAEACTVTGN
jgi:hypothetical protein